MRKKRMVTNKGELMEQTLTWEQQEVFRLLKAQPGTAYQESQTKQVAHF
jgi:hypothetical protein